MTRCPVVLVPPGPCGSLRDLFAFLFQVVGSEERKRTLTPLALRERYSVLNEPGLGESGEGVGLRALLRPITHNP